MSELAPARIVAGFDGSPASRAALSLALHRVGIGGRLVVVHAIRPPADHLGGGDVQKLLVSELDRARARVERLPEEIPGLASTDWRYELESGSPARAILRVAEAEHATEIVIGTRGTGRARSLLGSVAHDVLHGAACPVFVVPERAAVALDAAWTAA